MPIETIDSNLSAGEVSRSFRDRVDIEAYNASAEELRNVTVKVQGGVATRPGMSWFPFVQNADPARPLRSWAFEFDINERFLIAAHVGAIHVFAEDGAWIASLDHVVLTDRIVREMGAARSYDVMLFVHTDMKPLWLVRNEAGVWTLGDKLRDRDFTNVPLFGAQSVPGAAQVSIYGADMTDGTAPDLNNELVLGLAPVSKELEGPEGNNARLAIAVGELFEGAQFGRRLRQLTFRAPNTVTLGEVEAAARAFDALTVVASPLNPAARMEPPNRNLIEAEAEEAEQATATLVLSNGVRAVVSLRDVLNTVGRRGNAWRVSWVVRLFTVDFTGAGGSYETFDAMGVSTVHPYDTIMVNDWQGPAYEEFLEAADQQGDRAANPGAFQQADDRAAPNVGVSVSYAAEGAVPTVYITVDMVRTLYLAGQQFASTVALPTAFLTGSEHLAFPGIGALRNVLHDSAEIDLRAVTGPGDATATVANDVEMFDIATVRDQFRRGAETPPVFLRTQTDQYLWTRYYLASAGRIPPFGLIEDGAGSDYRRLGQYSAPVQREQWEFEGATFAGGTDVGSTVLRGELEKQFSGGSDNLEGGDPSFGDKLGWPVAAQFHQGRLWFAGSRSLPNAYWASVTNDVLDFDTTRPDEPDYGVFHLARGESTVIGWRHIFPGRHLEFLGDLSHGYVPVSGALTPTNISVRSNSSRGVEASVPPIDLDGATLFLQRGGRSLRMSVFDEEERAYRNTSLSLRAPHMLAAPVDLDYRPGGRSGDTDTVHVVDDAGWMSVLSVDRTAGVFAWSQWNSIGRIRTVTALDSAIWCVMEIAGRLALCRFDEDIELDFSAAAAMDPAGVRIRSDDFDRRALFDLWNGSGGCSLILDGVLYPGPFTVAADGVDGMIARADNPGLPAMFDAGEAGLRWPRITSEGGYEGRWRVKLLPFVARGKAAGFQRLRRIPTAETDFQTLEDPARVFVNGESLENGESLTGLEGHSKRAQIDILGERRAELVSVSYGVAL